MSMQLSPQAEELLGQSDLVSITERVDDGALLIGQMIPMGLPEVLDRPIPRHWKQRGLRWGGAGGQWAAAPSPESRSPEGAGRASFQGHATHPRRPTPQSIQGPGFR